MTMRHLKIFDFDNSEIATITWIDGAVFVCARSSREWSDMNRLINSGYKVSKEHPKFLEYVKERAHSYDFSTEITEEN